MLHALGAYAIWGLVVVYWKAVASLPATDWSRTA